MTKRNWLKSFMFLLLAGGLCSPAFAQGVCRTLCDTAPAGCASNGCASSGPASAGCGCADSGCASGIGSGLLGGKLDGCADGGCAGAGDGCADLAGEEESPWSFGGWLQTGYHTASNGQFNNYPDRFQLHQGYLYLEKAVDGSNGFDIGGRIDYVYGTDGPDTQAFGNNPGRFDEAWDNGGAYGHAIPQLYGEVAMGDISIKVGHFYTLVGYEVVTAPDNFFYSHAFTMYNAEPFTHTGVLATLPMGDVTTYGGWVQGWDTGFDDNGGNQFIGGFGLDLADGLALTYISLYGDIGNGTNLNGYNHSVVLDASLTENLNYVFQTDLVEYNDDTNVTADRRAIGVNQYLLYSLTEKVGVGTRVEWWNTEVAPGNKEDLMAWTFGLNVRPTDNIILRPEVRWNKDDAATIVPAASNEKMIFGVDAILTF